MARDKEREGRREKGKMIESDREGKKYEEMVK